MKKSGNLGGRPTKDTSGLIRGGVGFNLWGLIHNNNSRPMYLGL